MEWDDEIASGSGPSQFVDTRRPTPWSSIARADLIIRAVDQDRGL